MAGFRPQTVDEIYGQDTIKHQLSTYLEAACQRGEPLEHTLLLGPKGLGKTTFAYAIANAMGGSVQEAVGKQFGATDMHTTFAKVQPGDVVFIDEVHGVDKSTQEHLFPVMEDGCLHVARKGAPIKVRLPAFTLIGATTDDGGLAPPMKDRFGIQFTLEYYESEILQRIITRDAELDGIEADPAALAEIARRARGTPRIAKTLFRRVRDFAQVHNRAHLTVGLADETLTCLGIDSFGLDAVDRTILSCIAERGTAALSTIVATVGMDKATVLNGHEPYLVQADMIVRTSKGRALTNHGEHVVEQMG